MNNMSKNSDKESPTYNEQKETRRRQVTIPKEVLKTWCTGRLIGRYFSIAQAQTKYPELQYELSTIQIILHEDRPFMEIAKAYGNIRELWNDSRDENGYNLFQLAAHNLCTNVLASRPLHKPFNYLGL